MLVRCRSVTGPVSILEYSDKLVLEQNPVQVRVGDDWV
jgi:hypothetical protein